MGGSMAVRAGFSHPDIFSRVAALSPSYQNTLAATPAMPAYVRAQRLSLPFRLHQDVGTAEHIRELGPDVITRNMLAVRDAARAAGLVGEAQRSLLVDGATHDEGAWSARIREVLGWLWSP
jgi:enterochelin esterase-like enzyme